MKLINLDEAVRRAATIPKWKVHSNPRVGCAIECVSGKVFFGIHQKFGGLHAEQNALEEVTRAHDTAAGATVFVSLEPCSHFGKTPPCVEALIRAQVKKVVIGALDPFEGRAGQGVEKLRRGGIDVEVVSHVPSRELNLEWLFAHQHRRPFVRLKIATTADGFFALPDGKSKYITSQGALSDVHALRALSEGILSSVATIERDRAQLTVRSPDYSGPQPKVCALLSRKKQSQPDLSSVDSSRLILLHSDFSLKENLEKLYSDHSIFSLLVEAGPRLSASFLRERGLVQELYHFISPKYFGSGLGMQDLFKFDGLSGLRGARVQYKLLTENELLIKSFFDDLT